MYIAHICAEALPTSLLARAPTARSPLSFLLAAAGWKQPQGHLRKSEPILKPEPVEQVEWAKARSRTPCRSPPLPSPASRVGREGNDSHIHRPRTQLAGNASSSS